MKRRDHDISLRIEHDTAEVVVSEGRFHIHASGSTREEALAAFWRVFDGYEAVLAEHEDALNPAVAEQLRYVRAVKAYERQYERGGKRHDNL